MTILSRWLAPAVLAVGLGVAGLTPAPARADDNLARVIVDIADVIVRGGVPYYRYGNYGNDDRLIVVQDRYNRPTYYRHVPRGVAHGYWRNGPGRSQRECDSRGRCRVVYYDARYDRRDDWARNDRHGRYDRHEYRDRWDRDGRDGRGDRDGRDGRRDGWGD